MNSAIRAARTTVFSIFLFAAQSAFGAESGTFKSVSFLANSLSAMTHAGASAFSGTSTGINYYLESSGDLFDAGTSDRLDCIVNGTTTADGTNLDAYCTITDVSDEGGDALYLIARRRAENGSAGNVEILGGTGKFESLAGGCSYTVAAVGSDRQETTADCNWHRSSE